MILYPDISGAEYLAISWDSVTFQDLSFWMPGRNLSRCDPEIFLQKNDIQDKLVINLVTNMPMRAKICQHIEKINATRFTLSLSPIYQIENIQTGCFIYPDVTLYPSVKIDHDVIIHGKTLIAHACKVGKGAFLSAGITVCGSVSIGNYSWIGADSTFVPKVSVAEHTTVLARAFVKENIDIPNAVHKRPKNRYQ